MATYILRRLLLIAPTLFGMLLLSFILIQFTPGGPVERVLAQLQGTDVGATATLTSVSSLAIVPVALSGLPTL